MSFIWLITHFNPPTSCEVGHACLAVVIHVVVISIHPPPARWDAALMGHADASMTKYYQSEEYDKLKAIIDSL